jgi:hypothetical protein
VEVLQNQDERLAGRQARQSPGQQLENLDPVLGLALVGRGGDARIAADSRA